ncbi:carboxymuconolactone decarboxylase family protein, partial [Streptomyces sp. tea 10]|nr:carboxymuconolactone decarboxylase family protein [Streptomyces sp. tea 10]
PRTCGRTRARGPHDRGARGGRALTRSTRARSIRGTRGEPRAHETRIHGTRHDGPRARDRRHEPARDQERGPNMNPRSQRTEAQALQDGMTVRREVLSDAHVDRAESGKTEFTEDFQDFISRYAWGEIWTRPGLDRRMRSACVLTALIAAGHWEEFEMHVKAALRNGLSTDEIKEILLQSAIYLSVPSANNAFKHAQKALSEYSG